MCRSLDLKAYAIHTHLIWFLGLPMQAKYALPLLQKSVFPIFLFYERRTNMAHCDLQVSTDQVPRAYSLT